MPTLRSTLVASALTLALPWNATAQIFPTLDGNAQRTGQSPYVGPPDASTASLGSVKEPLAIKTPGAVAFDGSVYFGTDHGLIAFDRRGNHLWTFDGGGAAQGAPSIAFDGTIFFNSDGNNGGHLFSVTPEGNLQWTESLGSPVTTSPLIADDGDVIVVALDGSIVRFHQAGTTLERECEGSVGGLVEGSPAFGHDGRMYVAADTKISAHAQLFAIDDSCSVVSQRQLSGRSVRATPTLDAHGTAYVVSRSGAHSVLDRVPASPLVSAFGVTIPDVGAGGIALSTDGNALYAVAGGRPLALSTTTLQTLWVGDPSGSPTAPWSSTPTVDVDGNSYWTLAQEVRSYTANGHLRWSRSATGTLAPESSPVLGAHGHLYIGGRESGTAYPAVEIVEHRRPWPNSDQRLDLAASSGLLYSDVIYDRMVGMGMVTTTSIHQLKRVEPYDHADYDHRIVEYDRRWEKTEDTYLPIGADRAAYLASFNPDFFGYDVRINGPEHYTRFAHHWNHQNPHQPLGSYLSSITCVDDPQDPDPQTDAEKAKAGNTYPASVLDCCAITGTPSGTGSCHQGLGTPPLYDAVDGRHFLPLDQPTVIDATMDHLRTVLRDQHLTQSVFLDNGRYPRAKYAQARSCHECVTACAGDPTCISGCDISACGDDRDSGPVHLGSGYSAPMDSLMDYYGKLFDTLEGEGYRGILNTVVLPCYLGDVIERDWFTTFEDAIGPGHGIAFEAAWHSSCKQNPRLLEQEIRLYQDLLQKGTLILQYPSYSDPAEQLWTAAMAVSLREPGDPLFLSRSQYEETPTWADWADFYGAPVGDLNFQTSCPQCMVDYRRSGDWYTTREFVGQRQITTVGLFHPTVLVDPKEAGDSLEPCDAITGPEKALDTLLTGYDLDSYTMVHAPRLGTFDPVTGDYTLDSCAVSAAFNATYEAVDFGATYANYHFEDYIGLGKGCNTEGTHCDELVMVSLQNVLRINQE